MNGDQDTVIKICPFFVGEDFYYWILLLDFSHKGWSDEGVTKI